MTDALKNINAGLVKIKEGQNSLPPYEHQVEAISALNEMNKKTSFSTMVVLPTGGGKRG